MCAPVFKRVAETVMAQRRSDDYTAARDSNNCLNPVVSAGSLTAAQSVLEQLGIKFTSPVNTEDAPLTWGHCNTTSQGLNMNVVEEVKGNIVPDVRGYGLRDALFRLEKLGLKVKVRGIGRVTQQTCSPATTLSAASKSKSYLATPRIYRLPNATRHNKMPSRPRRSPTSLKTPN